MQVILTKEEFEEYEKAKNEKELYREGYEKIKKDYDDLKKRHETLLVFGVRK